MSNVAPVLLSAHNIHKSYLERVVLDDVNFTIHEGECVALLGANGAGKSTLLSILCETETPDSGEVRKRRDLTLSVLSQDGGLKDEWTVRQALEGAFAKTRALQKQLDDVHHALEAQPHGPEADRLMKQQADITAELERRDAWTMDSRMNEAARGLGLPEYDRVIGQLSGGERRRVALCRTLLEDADLLLLDEPTNHLDAETLDWLEEFLVNWRGTVLLVTHDRYFLDHVATKMIELWRGQTKLYDGNYSDYLAQKQEEALRAERAEATRQNLLRRELEWLRRQPKARTTKAKARVGRAVDLIEAEPVGRDATTEFFIPSGPRLGKTLIEAKDINYSVANLNLIRDFTFLLGAGERVGIVGRNGLGKTTLIRLLMKQLEPDSGSVNHGGSIKFVYSDQARRNLDPDKTVLDEIAGDVDWVKFGENTVTVRSWLKKFLFDDQTAAMPIRLLSGGERNRVQIAKMLKEGGNVVVLDEPTNDLDLPTLRVLEEALVNFDGCAFVVSHDRYFLNRVATRILSFRGNGEIVIVEGNYDHYRRWADTHGGTPPDEPQTPAAKPAEPKPKKAQEKKKLGYMEQREYDAMEEKIMEAEMLLEKLDVQVQDPNTFVEKDKETIAQLLAEHTAAKAEVDRLYERWTELGELAQ